MTGVEAQSASSPAYGELLNVMTRATARLSLDWSAERQECAPSNCLDECFLAGHKHSTLPSLPFLPELHNELNSPLANLTTLMLRGWKTEDVGSAVLRLEL